MIKSFCDLCGNEEAPEQMFSTVVTNKDEDESALSGIDMCYDCNRKIWLFVRDTLRKEKHDTKTTD